jgi:hypothetical protein
MEATARADPQPPPADTSKPGRSWPAFLRSSNGANRFRSSSGADSGGVDGRGPRPPPAPTTSTLHRGEVGDGRGSSANGLTSEFLGDYNYAVATREFGAAVWVDSRNAAVCAAINAHRQSLSPAARSRRRHPTGTARSLRGDQSGNTDIFGGSYLDPSTP